MARCAYVISLALLLGGCGGPPVGGSVPKANTKKMAIGAAAAATAITLIDPKSAGHKPESAEEEKEKKVKKSDESVPSDVFDRLETDPDDEPCEPDAKPDEDADQKSAVGPLPAVKNETREAAERERREKCREQQNADPDANPKP